MTPNVDHDGEGLALAVVRNPLDVVRRLILADWYEEVGRERDADLMRRDGQVVLTYDYVAYVTYVGFDVVVLFRHPHGESLKCSWCKTGIKTDEKFLLHVVGGEVLWVCTDCYLLRHSGEYHD